MPPGVPAAPRHPVAYRPMREADLDACTRLWKAAIEDYTVRLNQPPMPDELAPIRRLLAHTLVTDPARCWVAVPADDAAGSLADAAPLLGFASATVREGLWFLGMLFVAPGVQASGVGSALLDRAQAGRDVDPGGPAVPGPDAPFDTGIHTWGMCTDSLQPISNALYARRGMTPRVPVYRLYGEVRRWSALPRLPDSLEAVAFEAAAGSSPEGARRLRDAVDALDREVFGAAHPAEHGWLRNEGRSGFLVRDRADGRALGYAYGSAGGRLGPVLALDPDLHPALLGVAIRETPVLSTMAAWTPGTADRATRALLDAGLRYDGFPALVCWSRPDHPFDRYVLGSLALV